MTTDEARKLVKAYYENSNLTEEDFFRYTEAMSVLIEKLHDPEDMMALGGEYYERRDFDLALKYYELAASYDHDPAYECLGYIWYYGRTGEPDYQKAYESFSRSMKKGNLVSAYKVADMYKNGYYVPKDRSKYESMIEELYQKVKDSRNVFDPLPEIFTRLARIRKEQERYEEALDLFLKAKQILAQRIRHNAFFGYRNIMKWLIGDLYELLEFDEENFDFYDLYYLLKKPCEVTFYCNDEKYRLEAVPDGAECNICFDGKVYRDPDEFFEKAHISDRKLTELYPALYGFALVRKDPESI